MIQPTTIQRYVAIGDSLTEGIWDWGQGQRQAGFAYLLAEQLRHSVPHLEFHNLGVGGARTADLLRKQVDRALALGPDLITVVCGANDVPTTSVPVFQQQYEELMARLRAGTDGMIVASNLPDAAHLLPAQFASYRAALIQRVDQFNEIIRATAAQHGMPLVDLFSNPATADRRNVSRDGVHPNPRGYQIMAQAFATTLNTTYGLELVIADPA